MENVFYELDEYLLIRSLLCFCGTDNCNGIDLLSSTLLENACQQQQCKIYAL